MFKLGSRLVQFNFASDPTSSTDVTRTGTQLSSETLKDFLINLRRIGGLKKEDIYSNLRIPYQCQTAKDEINLVILTGHGVFCLDVKTWTGAVSAQNQNWHLRHKEEDPNFTNTSIEQVSDPLQAITTKAINLWSYMKQNGVSICQTLFIPRVLFLSPDCQLDEELKKSRELISHSEVEAFLRSFREGYLAWISDALTPSWLTGHLSYRQIGEVKEVLRRMGTWDIVMLHCGMRMKGDYLGCQHIALNRQETDALEFSRVKILSAGSLWALLGHAPQVTVKMYKRGGHSWLGKPLIATTTIPYNTNVIFRISGDDIDTKIPANSIQSISLSI